MGWPKGKPRGTIPQTTCYAITLGQRRRWADPENRARAISGLKKSWECGKLSRYHVTWTPEMDDMLRKLYFAEKFSWLRRHGAARIGVGEPAIRARIKELGLSKPKRIRVFSKKKVWTEADDCLLAALYVTCSTVDEIAGLMSLSRCAIIHRSWKLRLGPKNKRQTVRNKAAQSAQQASADGGASKGVAL